MRKILYTIGCLTSISFVSGWVMGMLHLPGARELSIYGFLGFVIIFLPVLSIDHHRARIKRTTLQKAKFLTGLSSALLVALSVIFKLLELQGAAELLTTGAGLFVVAFLPLQFYSMYRIAIP